MTYSQDRGRAVSFGDNAERYDRARPSYPAGLVDDLLANRAVQVLDVGCGTGLAGRLFASRGCQVLGVEPDPRMAAVARAHGLLVEEGTFEDWEPVGRSFGLVVSAQAWHWVDPDVGPAKAAKVLDPGGIFAAFWNRLRHSPEVQAVLEDAYRAHAPELFDDNVPLGTKRRPSEASDPDLERLRATGAFMAVERKDYQWERVYTADLWVDELLTHSIHRSLDPAHQKALMEDMATGLEPITPFRVHYTTAVLVATKKTA